MSAGSPPKLNWSDMVYQQNHGTLIYYSKYVCTDLDDAEQPIPGTEQVCHFGDSATILGIRIGGVVCLNEDEAESQIAIWNESGEGSRTHLYSIYDPKADEAGRTPRLPGMRDIDLDPDATIMWNWRENDGSHDWMDPQGQLGGGVDGGMGGGINE